MVKFVSDKTAFDAVYYTVMDALNRAEQPARQEEKPFYRTMTAQEFEDVFRPQA